MAVMTVALVAASVAAVAASLAVMAVVAAVTASEMAASATKASPAVEDSRGSQGFWADSSSPPRPSMVTPILIGEQAPRHSCIGGSLRAAGWADASALYLRVNTEVWIRRFPLSPGGDHLGGALVPPVRSPRSVVMTARRWHFTAKGVVATTSSPWRCAAGLVRRSCRYANLRPIPDS